jgi:hypothetical protein
MAAFLLGIPWLANFFGILVTGLIVFFAKFLTKKLAIFAAIIVALTTLTLAMVASLHGLLLGISGSWPPELNNLGFIVPSNAIPCISAGFTATFSHWVYRWNVRVWQMKLFL